LLGLVFPLYLPSFACIRHIGNNLAVTTECYPGSFQGEGYCSGLWVDNEENRGWLP